MCAIVYCRIQTFTYSLYTPYRVIHVYNMCDAHEDYVIYKMQIYLLYMSATSVVILALIHMNKYMYMTHVLLSILMHICIFHNGSITSITDLRAIYNINNRFSKKYQSMQLLQAFFKHQSMYSSSYLWFRLIFQPIILVHFSVPATNYHLCWFKLLYIFCLYFSDPDSHYALCRNVLFYMLLIHISVVVSLHDLINQATPSVFRIFLEIHEILHTNIK